MFFHGIDLCHLQNHYPILSPRQSVGSKSEEQLADRKHLIDRFGLEPVHLLEYWRGEYEGRDCLKSCFLFGNTVLAFSSIPLPFWQLSRFEIGVPILDVRRVRWIFYKDYGLKEELRSFFPGKKIIFVKESDLNLM
ncbi:MAG TPA: hypothetical protein DDY49_05785 [Paenibacillaceae bacterium]|nr:hypothetical protein [Paenibacillaceae bacterium]